MDKLKLTHLLSIQKVVEKQPEKKKSDAWKYFTLLYYKDSDEFTNYVKCKDCGTFLKHHKAHSGTTHLAQHIKVCMKTNKGASTSTSNVGTINNTKQTKVTAYCAPKSGPPQSAKTKMHAACLQYVACDLHPLKSVEGKGLRNLIQAAIQVGATYGVLPAAELLPSRLTVKRKLECEAKVIKSTLLQEIKNAIQENGIVGISTDMWTDIKVRHFVSLTVHYVTNAILASHVLSVYQFEKEEKTGANLRESITSALNNHGVPLHMILDNIYFVTDQGSNVKAALNSYHRLPCSCHMIATVLRHTLQLNRLSSTILPMNESDDDMVHMRMLQSVINAAKSLVTYFKKSGLNNKLTKTLKQSNDTRWNSVLTMLQSISMKSNQF